MASWWRKIVAIIPGFVQPEYTTEQPMWARARRALRILFESKPIYLNKVGVPRHIISIYRISLKHNYNLTEQFDKCREDFTQ